MISASPIFHAWSITLTGWMSGHSIYISRYIHDGWGLGMQSEIKQWGNSAAIRLPKTVLAQAGLDVASQVEIEVKEGQIMIQAVSKPTPVLALPYSEAELLLGLTPLTAHADELPALAVNEWEY